MRMLERHDAVAAARLAAGATALVLLVAAAVRLAAAQHARELLGFEFPGLEPRVGEAVAILLNNARLLAAVLVACLVVQAARPQPEARGLERVVLRLIVGSCDVVLVAAAAFHVAFVGAAMGAYGQRTLAALLPHGPFELGAFALALAVYLAARREPVSRQRIVGIALVSLAGLVLAALLEVFA
jgi:hypothetical protein